MLINQIGDGHNLQTGHKIPIKLKNYNAFLNPKKKKKKLIFHSNNLKYHLIQYSLLIIKQPKK